MKTIFILSAFLCSGITFGQTKPEIRKLFQETATQKSISNGTFVDLSKQDAFEEFKKSNVRQELGFQLREFNFELMSMYAKKFKVPMSKMIILNNLNSAALDEIKTAFKGADNPILCNECYYIPYKLKINQ